MATKDLKLIEQGDRVVYAAGDKQYNAYNAIALGSPTSGFNQGIKLSSLFLRLIYLNERGVPVTVSSAPLLAVAADEEHLKNVAEDAAQRDLSYKAADEKGRARLLDEKLAHVKANPHTIGWRPYEDGEEFAKLRVENTQLKAQIEDLKADADKFRTDHAYTLQELDQVNEKLAEINRAGACEEPEPDPAVHTERLG